MQLQQRLKQGMVSLVLVVLTSLLWMGTGNVVGTSAIATIRQLEEAPGQVVYQSRYTLQDQHGQRWQAIVFKRIRPDGSSAVNLRLVGFPGAATIDRDRALELTDSLSRRFKADDASSNVFTDSDRPEPHVGQYNLQPIVAQLRPELPLQMTLPVTEGKGLKIVVPPTAIQEWQTIANKVE